jgi:hypothetical protein
LVQNTRSKTHEHSIQARRHNTYTNTYTHTYFYTYLSSTPLPPINYNYNFKTMIASSSTIRALLIATLAVVGSANNESSTLLRGNSVKQEQEAFDVDVDERRNLVEIDMTMGFGEMVCKEHISLDGSVVCTFRTTPPTDMVSNTIQKGCVYTTTSNSNFCLASQVNRVPYNYEVPDASQAIEVVIQTVKPVPPSQPVLPTQPVTPVIGACPSFQPNTGITCSMYIPIGNTETACVYGQLKCSCALQNSDRSIAVGWDCFIIPEVIMSDFEQVYGRDDDDNIVVIASYHSSTASHISPSLTQSLTYSLFHMHSFLA